MDSRRVIASIGLVVAIVLAIVGNIEKRAMREAPRAALVAQVANTPDTYTVAKVVDGDTLDIVMTGKAVRVRLIGLDTPEIVDPRKPVQCFAREASGKAKQTLNGQSVRIETDPSQDTYDTYGRLLAYVYLSDGILFNKYMVAEGYGHEYTYRLPYKYQADFKAAEKSARENKKGLWADDMCAGNTKQPSP